MTIELKPEQERILADALRQGRFHSMEEALDQAIRSIALQEKSPVQNGETPHKKSLSQFLMDSPLAGSELQLDRDPNRELS